MPLYAVASARTVARCAGGSPRISGGAPGWPWHAAVVPFDRAPERDGELVRALCGLEGLVLFGHFQWRGPGAAHGCPECWVEAHSQGAWGAVSLLHSQTT